MHTQNVVLRVEGMSCRHCAAAIEKAVRALPGVENVRVDLGRKEVEVAFAPETTSVDDIAAAITDAGYVVVGAGRN